MDKSYYGEQIEFAPERDIYNRVSYGYNFLTTYMEKGEHGLEKIQGRIIRSEEEIFMYILKSIICYLKDLYPEIKITYTCSENIYNRVLNKYKKLSSYEYTMLTSSIHNHQ